MKKIIIALSIAWGALSHADFVHLNDAGEFKQFVANSDVPVVVEFGASWCHWCQILKDTFEQVAPNYNDSQVKLAYVDADANPSLQKYILGGYPTTHAFKNGQTFGKNFSGSVSSEELTQFIDSVIGNEEMDLTFSGPTCTKE